MSLKERINIKTYSRDNNNLHARTNILILAFFLFYYLKTFVYYFPQDIFHGLFNWVYTDWLIDYSSGFVRRGLSGVVVDLLSRFAHPRIIIGLLVWIIFSIFVFGYIRLLYRSINKLSPFLYAALLFLPCLIPFYLYDHGTFGRKEIIGYLILLWHLFSIEAVINRESEQPFKIIPYIKKLVPITLILIPAHLLSHESSFLLFVPIHLLITISMMQLDTTISNKRKIVYVFLSYLPIVVVFFVVILFGNSSFEMAQSICRKWEVLNAFTTESCNQELPAALSALPKTLNHTIVNFLSFPRSRVYFWFTAFVIMTLSTLYFGRITIRKMSSDYYPAETKDESRKIHSKMFSMKYFILPLIITIPLYITAVDYGRWIAVSCINFIMLSLSDELHYVESKIGCNFNLKNRYLRIGSIVMGIGFVFFGQLSRKLGIGEGGVEAFVYIIGLILLFYGIFIQIGEKIVSNIPIRDNDFLYYIFNVFLLLLILFVIKLPSCCIYEWYEILVEPFRTFVRILIN